MGSGGGAQGTGTWKRELLGPALIVVASAAIELVTRFVVRIPNPPALLLILVVFAAFHGGMRSGLVSAGLAWGYFTLAFSDAGALFHYGPDNLKRVVLWGVLSPIMAVMVGSLRTRALAAERAASRAAEERFTKAFHASPVAILLTRLSDGFILDANAVMLETLGFEREELIGKTVKERPLWRTTDVRADIVERLRAVGTIRGVDLEARRKSGERVDLLGSMERVTVNDEECILSFAIDMTERRRAADAMRRKEEELLRSQKMEAIGRLAGGIAHDFNNLLTIIGGNASLLATTLEDDASRRFIDEISLASEQAASLTRQLLSFSRQEAVRPRAIDLGALVAKLAPLLSRMIGDDVVLSTVLAPSLGSVHADPGQIDQVITNLVINARDAMAGGGNVTIETSEMTLDEADVTRLGGQARTGQFVVLTVRDTGEGMDEATIGRIFEPFFTTKARGRGTGLGLATVYGIVTGSKGFVSVESVKGGGTSFGVYLPRHDPAPESAVAAPPKEAATGRERILLVEDSLAVRTVTATILTDLGYDVVVAEDTRDAIAIAEREAASIALVLTDVIMPEMNGRELVARLTPLLPKAKVLFCSDHSDDARLDESIRAEKVAFLPKPFTRETLAAKVRSVLDG